MSALIFSSCKRGNLTYISWSRLSSSQFTTTIESSTQQDASSSSISDEADRVIKRISRQSHAAEVAAAGFFRGQMCRPGGHARVDLNYFSEQEQQQLGRTQDMLIRHRSRPSLMQGMLELGGVALGAVAAAAPARINLAITGAVQDALTEHFTEHLRDLQETGFGAQCPDVRETIRGLRNVERAPEGAPPAPDLLALSKMSSLADLGVEGVVGAVVKAGALAVLGVTSKL